MSIMNFLKSRIGAVSMKGFFSTSIVIGMTGWTIYNYVTASPAIQEQKVRNLASIMASGGNIGEYSRFSSINVSRGEAEFLSPEEQANKDLFDGGERAVAALDGLKVGSNGGVEGIGTIEGRALGAGDDSLGINEKRELIEKTGGQAAFAAQKGDVSGVDGAAKGADKEGDKGPTLQRASIARHSGGSGSASFSGNNGDSFGPSGSAGRSAAQEKANRINPSSVGAGSISSGAMPNGSTLVAANQNIRGAGSTTFVGGSRKSRDVVGINSAVGQTLKDIAIVSGDTALNAARKANEGGSRAFMNGGKGIAMQVDDITTGSSFGGEGKDVYSTAGDPQINAVNEAVQEKVDYEKEKESHRRRLLQNMLILLGATFVAMVAIAQLSQGDGWSKLAAAIITAAMAAAIIIFLVDAGKFAKKYDDWNTFGGFFVAGAVMAAGLVLAWINKTNGWLQKVGGFFAKNMGLKLLGGAVAALLMGKAFSSTQASVDAIDKGYDDKDKDNLSNQ